MVFRILHIAKQLLIWIWREWISLAYQHWVFFMCSFFLCVKLNVLWMFMMNYVPLVVSTFWSFPYSWLIIGFVTRLPRRLPLVQQKLLTLPEHLSSPAVFSGVRVTRSLVLCLFCVDRCLSFCPFSFGHFVLLQILITSLASSNSSRQCWSFLIWHIRVNMAHKTSLNLSLFIEVPVPSQKSERSCYWVSVVSILLLSTIFLLELFRQCGICFCFFIFFVLNIPRYLVLR